MPELVCAVARRLFAATVDHYIDDYASCEPDFARGMTTASTVAALRQPGSTQGVLYRTAYTLGAPVSKDKHSAHSQQPIFIGVETDLTHFTTERVILLRCKASTRVKVLGLIDHYLTDGATMSSAQAATLAGKCQWVLANGRVSQSALAALSACQYSSDAWSKPSYCCSSVTPDWWWPGSSSCG